MFFSLSLLILCPMLDAYVNSLIFFLFLLMLSPICLDSTLVPMPNKQNSQSTQNKAAFVVIFV